MRPSRKRGRPSKRSLLEELLEEPYPLEDVSVAEELDREVGNDPNASNALLEASGLADWSSREFGMLDRWNGLGEGFDFVPMDHLLDYVMERYCMYAPDSIEWKYLAMSLMLSVTLGSVRMYGIDRGFRNELRFLLNVFGRVYRSMNGRGFAVVPAGLQ